MTVIILSIGSQSRKKQTRANGKEVQKHIRMLAGVGAETITIAVSNDTTLTSAVDVAITIREV